MKLNLGWLFFIYTYIFFVDFFSICVKACDLDEKLSREVSFTGKHARWQFQIKVACLFFFIYLILLNFRYLLCE